ncbi:HAMP domain-containing protein [Desulfosarcina cetonica]|uniref:HAMP domain-containing protein n=1 Tax=Desulfosarcina cetonica TaxID=90730 RepID=UPI0006D2C596|nr:HAMP domain-containing protein [Desulfosarcina cetonica]
MIGIDMRADEMDRKLYEIRLAGLLSLLASLLLALLFALYLSRGFTGRINTLIRRCQQITLGRYDETLPMQTFDEFDELVEAFNTMSVELAQAIIKRIRPSTPCATPATIWNNASANGPRPSKPPWKRCRCSAGCCRFALHVKNPQ